MKLAKLSLAAIAVVGLTTSSFAADTLADAFKNGKVKGELKAWYFDQNSETSTTTTNANIINTGITLGYVTDALYGFSFGATFQASANPATAETSARTVFVNDQYTGGSTLSEAYLAYTIGKTTVKAGRQFIATPLVSGSGSRIFQESFEGVTIVNTDLPQTTLIAGYVSKFQGRTSAVMGDAAGDAPKFENRAAFTGGASSGLILNFEDAYTAAVINKSITNLTLTAQYALVTDVDAGGITKTDDVDVYYVEANYVLPMSGFKLGFDANYRGSKTGTALDFGNYEGDYTAARISLSELAGFGASFAAATTDSTDSTIAGMGNGPTSYTSTMIRGTSTRMLANTDSYLFAATYDFAKIGVSGLTALVQYGWTKQDRVGSAATSADYTNIAAGVTYAIPALKGLTTSLQYETQETETKTYATGAQAALDKDELWFKAGYKF